MFRHSRLRPLKTPSRSLRAALAVTELAIGLPVVLVVAMGTMEACTMIRLRQKLKIIAYEGARVGVLPEAGIVNVQYQCQLLSQDQSLALVDIATEPADPTTLSSGDWLKVEATAPFNANSLTGTWMSSAFSLTESVSMQKP
ncbi:TadE/TadG family type IV pilus assembly protein [Neorhodopirellula pilleata]|uniref:TadE-like protein n=1 Tax=Neorhodopirellula pilleata TaxID=2714738 RepID=A0A5C6AI20_9BACT|nr:TadE family protein [Neorhodopirellula pilleata]TWT98815.1 TadE-like protein [Neorhodopirellula pilleata]